MASKEMSPFAKNYQIEAEQLTSAFKKEVQMIEDIKAELVSVERGLQNEETLKTKAIVKQNALKEEIRNCLEEAKLLIAQIEEEKSKRISNSSNSNNNNSSSVSRTRTTPKLEPISFNEDKYLCLLTGKDYKSRMVKEEKGVVKEGDAFLNELVQSPNLSSFSVDEGQQKKHEDLRAEWVKQHKKQKWLPAVEIIPPSSALKITSKFKADMEKFFLECKDYGSSYPLLSARYFPLLVRCANMVTEFSLIDVIAPFAQLFSSFVSVANLLDPLAKGDSSSFKKTKIEFLFEISNMMKAYLAYFNTYTTLSKSAEVQNIFKGKKGITISGLCALYEIPRNYVKSALAHFLIIISYLFEWSDIYGELGNFYLEIARVSGTFIDDTELPNRMRLIYYDHCLDWTGIDVPKNCSMDVRGRKLILQNNVNICGFSNLEAKLILFVDILVIVFCPVIDMRNRRQTFSKPSVATSTDFAARSIRSCTMAPVVEATDLIPVQRDVLWFKSVIPLNSIIVWDVPDTKQNANTIELIGVSTKQSTSIKFKTTKEKEALLATIVRLMLDLPVSDGTKRKLQRKKSKLSLLQKL